MKIVFLIPSLRGGGAERVASTLCNHWAANGHQIVIITFDTKDKDFYKSNETITRYELNSHDSKPNLVKKIYANLQRLARTRKIIKQEQPDVVLSFMPVPNMQAILACLFTGIPVVISERIYPPYFNHNDVFDLVRKVIYKFCSAFVAQTRSIALWGSAFLKNKKIAVIVNPLNTNALVDNINVMRSNTILAMGRLSTDKGFDMLIQAFAQIHQDHPEWDLQIVGEGIERHKLEQMLQSFGLSDKVYLIGQSNTPQNYYASAKIFVLSSRVEGFPNVLMEAMANGLPVVSFDCNSGPADIIIDGINGLLVPANDIDYMAAALQRLMVDAELRDKLSTEAVKVRDKCKLDIISEQWFRIFEAVT